MSDTQTAFLQALLGSSSGVNTGDSVLNSFGRTLSSNNMWKQAALPILGTRFDTSSWSPVQSIGATAAQAFLGSVLNGLGQRSEAQQLEKVAAVMPQLYADPTAVELPEGVDKEAFNQLKLGVTRENLLRDAKAKAEKASLMNDIFKTKTIEEFKAELGLESKKAEAELERDKKKNQLLGEQDAFAQLGIKNPDSPQAKIERTVKEEEDARRKEIAALAPAVSLGNTLTSLPALDKLAKDDSKTSDIPFTYKYIMGLDGGVVKDGERYMIQGGNTILQQYKSVLEGALTGKSQLTPQLKQQMVKELKISAQNQAEALKLASENIFRIGEGRGASRANMSPFSDDYLKTVLSVEDIVNEPGKVLPDIPPGMKLQRNRVTGEIRMVPQ